jgi:hypothetical protein
MQKSNKPLLKKDSAALIRVQHNHKAVEENSHVVPAGLVASHETSKSLTSSFTNPRLFISINVFLPDTFVTTFRAN